MPAVHQAEGECGDGEGDGDPFGANQYDDGGGEYGHAEAEGGLDEAACGEA